MKNKQLASTAFSLAMLGGALGFLWLAQFFNDDEIAPLETVQIQVVQPEPPPPPPKTRQVVEKTNVELQVEGDGPVLTMTNMEVDVEVETPDMPEVQLKTTRWQEYKIDLDAYKLADLDSQPSLLTPINLRFPQQLKRRGVDRVMLKLDVMIDERGEVTLLKIIDNPYHELVGEIKRFVDKSKFTSPYKDSRPVKARFIWPLEIKA